MKLVNHFFVLISRRLIAGYRFFVSPLLGSHCRFYPSCSAYADEALSTHGFMRGSWLTAGRLCRCQPWCEGGVDPVPARLTKDSTSKSGLTLSPTPNGVKNVWLRLGFVSRLIRKQNKQE